MFAAARGGAGLTDFYDTFLYVAGPSGNDFNEVATTAPWATTMNSVPYACGYGVLNFDRGTTLVY